MTVSKTDVRRMESDPAWFRAKVQIDTDDGPRVFAECMDDWQRQVCVDLDQAWRRAAGQDVECSKSRLYAECPRGSGKTLFLALQIAWLLAFARRELQLAAAACDRAQAGLFLNAIGRLVRMNPWLSDAIEVQASKIIGKRSGSTLELLSSDVAGSFGRTLTGLVCDEAALWSDQGLWDSLISSAAKVRHSVICVATNAGFCQSWPWEVREAIRQDPQRWHFVSVDRPASWISREHLEEQRRLLPPKVYSRLWENVWSSGGGDALTEEDIAMITTADGPDTHAVPGATYVAGLDLSTKRDASGLTLLAVEPMKRRVRVAGLWRWLPVRGRISITEIEQTIRWVHERFALRHLSFDPFQAHLLCERLGTIGLPTVEVTFGGQSSHRMASTLLQAVREGRLSIYPHDELIRDLLKLRIEERAWGWTLTAPRDQQSHADLAFSLVVGLVGAVELLGRLGEVRDSPTSFRTELPSPRRHGVLLERGRAPWDAWHRN